MAWPVWGKRSNFGGASCGLCFLRPWSVSLTVLVGIRGELIPIVGVPIMVAALAAAVPIVILSPSSSAEPPYRALAASAGRTVSMMADP